MFHPATAIFISACALTVVLRAQGSTLVLAAAAVVAAYPVLRVSPAAALSLLRRARVLLASILLVHAWLTPGQPLLSALGPFSPTLEGARDALWRATALTAAIGVIALLIARTTPASLAAGLATLARPLGRVADVFALRLALTLQLAAQPLAVAVPAPAPGTGRVQRIVDRLAGRYEAALACAPLVPSLEPRRPPPLAASDWLAISAAAACAVLA